MRSLSKEQQGVQAVEIGLRLATSLAQAGRPMTLGELSTASGLHPSKTHRYLVSLVRSGLLEQDSRDQRYKLGGGAVYLGLAAQKVLDEYQLLNYAIETLHQECGQAIAVMIWGTYGPVVIRQIEPAGRPVMAVARLGASITILNSASGRLFAAFLPSEMVAPAVDRDLAAKVVSAVTNKPIKKREFLEALETVKQENLASVDGIYRAGYSTLGVPVFGPHGEMLYAITMIAPSGTMDLTSTGKPAQALRKCAEYLEGGLGVRPQSSAAPIKARS